MLTDFLGIGECNADGTRRGLRPHRVFCVIACFLLAACGCTYTVPYSSKTITASRLRTINTLIDELIKNNHSFDEKDNIDSFRKAVIQNKLTSEEAARLTKLGVDGWDQEMVLRVTVDNSNVIIEVTDGARTKYSAKTVIDTIESRVVSRSVIFEE